MPDTQIRITSLSVIPSNKNDFLACNSHSCMSAFPQDKYLTLICRVLYVYFPHDNIKNKYTQGPDLVQLIFFASSRTFLHE